MWGSVAKEMTATPMDWNAALQDLDSPQCSKRQSPCVQRVEEGCVLWPDLAHVPQCQCMKSAWKSITDYMPVSEALTHMLSSGCVRVCVHVYTIVRQLPVWGAWWSMITKVSRAVVTGQEGQTVGALRCKYKGFGRATQLDMSVGGQKIHLCVSISLIVWNQCWY